MSTGYIYLIECVGDYDNSYKIGFTRNKDVSKRIKNLQTGNKDKMKCIDSFFTQHGRKIETSLHCLYSHKRKNGEWFELDINDILCFKTTCTKLEENLTILENMNNPFI